jgi:hypothetical protein
MPVERDRVIDGPGRLAGCDFTPARVLDVDEPQQRRVVRHPRVDFLDAHD